MGSSSSKINPHISIVDQLTIFLNTKQKTIIEYGKWSITLVMKTSVIFAHFVYNSGYLDFNQDEDEFHKNINKDITAEQLYKELQDSNGRIYKLSDVVYEPYILT